MERTQPRKYEEYAYVLDFVVRGKSATVRGRDGIIVTVLGEERLTILELLALPNSTFEIGERVYIGKEGRTKILSVLGRLEYSGISSAAQSELPGVVEKTYMKSMIEEREKKKFTDFKDLQDRVGLKEPVKQIAKRILEEITGETRMNLFVRR